MKTDSGPNGNQSVANDADLRQAMREALPAAMPHDLAALQQRILVQWEMRKPVHGISAMGPAAALLHGMRTHRWQWLVAALVIALALGMQAQRKVAEYAADDLLEPDVLSLMTLGEL